MKLQKTVTESGQPNKLTFYVGGIVYEDNVRKFMSTEEGRIVLETSTPEYQYHMKDHLGNVRLTFTTASSAQQTSTYMATMEPEAMTLEAATFNNIETTRQEDKIFNHTPGGKASARLNAAEDRVMGPSMTLQVMPGDTVRIQVQAKYFKKAKTKDPIAGIASIVAASLSGGAVSEAPQITQGIQETLGIGQAGLASKDNSVPKAYINYLFFDKENSFKKGGFKQVSEAALGSFEELTLEYIPEEEGTVMIYTANQTAEDLDVYMDDMMVMHTEGPIIRVDDYYPFGMTFNTSERSGYLTNKYLYNGKELQTDLDLGWLDYGWRMYDPAIARWSVVDNLSEKYHSLSTYHYAGNNPVRNIDIDGNEFTESGKRWAEKLWNEISNRISANNDKINKKMSALETGYDKKGKPMSKTKMERYGRQVDRLYQNNAELTSVANEIITLDNSSQVYNVVESSSLNEAGSVQGMGNTVAATSFNFNTGAVDITISSNAGLGMFAHELKHAYQFDVGQISLGSLGGLGAPFLLDKHDEVVGYQRQALFGSRESGANGISSLPNRYSSLPTGPTDVNNYSYQGRPISQMNEHERNRLSKIVRQAFRVNGTTYQGR